MSGGNRNAAQAAQDKVSERSFYDRLFSARKRFDQFDPELYRRVARAARAGTTGTVALDLGCGSGTQAVCLMEEGFSVLAADLSREATRVARATAAAAGKTLRVTNADAEHIPLPDNSVDAVVCGLLLHHFGSLDTVAAELKRIVRPGGVVVALDANAHNPPTWLFLNVVHRTLGLKGLTPNQRALRGGEVERAFAKQGFGGFQFSSVTSALRKDWLGTSIGAKLNYTARATLLGISNAVLPQIARGNMLMSVFQRRPGA